MATSILDQLFQEETTSTTTSNTSTKIFLLEKAIAELTSTTLVLKEELLKVKSELTELKQSSTPSVLNNTIDTKLSLEPPVQVQPKQEQVLPNVTYLSTVGRVMDVKQYEYVGKAFQKYLIELVERPGVYELHRDMQLTPIEQGMKMLHSIDGNKIKGYRIQYQ